MDKYAVLPDHSDGGTSIGRPGECARVAADMLAFSRVWYYVRSHSESVVLCPGKDQVAGCGSFGYEFGSGGLPLRGRGQIVLPVLEEGFLDAPGGGGCDVL